jgi:hypothetical protein
MTDHSENAQGQEAPPSDSQTDPFPELSELEEKIQRRLRSNQKFLERFMDEDFEDLDEDDPEDMIEEEDPNLDEEL